MKPLRIHTPLTKPLASQSFRIATYCGRIVTADVIATNGKPTTCPSCLQATPHGVMPIETQRLLGRCSDTA